MKKAASYTAVFTVGFVACGVALKTLGDPSSLLPGTDSKAKQAVLASLNTTPAPMHRAVGDSVVADAAAKLEPAIVDIHTKGRAVRQAASPFSNDPLLQRFFGGQGGPPQVTEGAGSGVIISPDGYIMTNDHVIKNTATVKVTVGQGDSAKEYTARVVGTDPYTDIAVVKINTDGRRLAFAQLGNSDDVRVGDWAIAVGNPLNIGTTVTLGIISAKDRKDLQAEGSHLAGSRIQTDAAINPGNSGGALADINGRVIGINEAIYSPTGSYVGIGFAIPINDARKVAEQLIQSGKVVRPYLGISYGPLKAIDDLNARREYGLPLSSDDGVVVRAISPNSPASAAGLLPGDLILEADGQKIATTDSLNDLIQKKSVGQTLTLSITRKGQPRTVRVTLRERPAAYGQAPSADQGQEQQPDQGQQPDSGNPFQQLIP